MELMSAIIDAEKEIQLKTFIVGFSIIDGALTQQN